MSPIFIAFVAFAELFAFFIIPRFVMVDSNKYDRILGGDDNKKSFLIACVWELIIFNAGFLIGLAVGMMTKH